MVPVKEIVPGADPVSVSNGVIAVDPVLDPVVDLLMVLDGERMFVTVGVTGVRTDVGVREGVLSGVDFTDESSVKKEDAPAAAPIRSR